MEDKNGKALLFITKNEIFLNLKKQRMPDNLVRDSYKS